MNQDDPLPYILCKNYIWVSNGAYTACYLGTESRSVIYVSMQLLVVESILILRIWAITGKRRWILWTFFGLLVCSTTTSILISVNMSSPSLQYAVPTLIFEAVIFIFAAYHGIKGSGGMRSLLLQSKGPFRYGPKPILRLVLQGSVLYFIAALGSLPIIAFVDSRLGVTIMSVTITHMLLRLRKQGNSNTIGPSSQGTELTTFRATSNGAMSSGAGEDIIDILPHPQGS